jgi:murein DD-endopeptidase MepM/ murein hydrolase activator NlpD
LYRALLGSLVVSVLAGAAMYAGSPPVARADAILLPPTSAIGIQLDTFLVGGYASGRFADAVGSLDGDLSREERVMIGEHIEKIFAGILPPAGLARTGRLRIAYERAVAPAGTTRSIRVLGAEVASEGRIHTAFYFDDGKDQGYFDPAGSPLQAQGGTGPLPVLRVTSRFGSSRMHPILNRVLPHTGVDLAGRQGEPVRAAGDGIVTSAGANGGYGLLVELSHPNGRGTRYAHLSRIAPGVLPRRVVHQGDVIGYVGMTGLATGPHLHFEIRRRGLPVDPMAWLAGSSFASIPATAEWSRERRILSTLLARTPTVVVRDDRASASF